MRIHILQTYLANAKRLKTALSAIVGVLGRGKLFFR